MPKQAQRPVEPVRRVLLTKTEAAAAMGMSVNHFERHVQPHLKLVPSGQLVLIPPAELDRWVRSNARRLISQPD